MSAPTGSAAARAARTVSCRVWSNPRSRRRRRCSGSGIRIAGPAAAAAACNTGTSSSASGRTSPHWRRYFQAPMTATSAADSLRAAQRGTPSLIPASGGRRQLSRQSRQQCAACQACNPGADPGRPSAHGSWPRRRPQAAQHSGASTCSPQTSSRNSQLCGLSPALMPLLRGVATGTEASPAPPRRAAG